MLSADGHVCLTDFGFAKEVINFLEGERTVQERERGRGNNPNARKQTGDGHTGTWCGTTEYMAPEILKKNQFLIISLLGEISSPLSNEYLSSLFFPPFFSYFPSFHLLILIYLLIIYIHIFLFLIQLKLLFINL